MNLHNIVAPVIAAINPWLTASYQQSTTPTIGIDFTQTPGYLPAVNVQVQKQPIQWKDLQQVSGLNLVGEKCVMYVSGNWQGVSRPASKGGDLVTLPDGTVWLVIMPLENWYSTDGWTKVACVLQNGS